MQLEESCCFLPNGKLRWGNVSCLLMTKKDILQREDVHSNKKLTARQHFL
jgi:hypothetical protein